MYVEFVLLKTNLSDSLKIDGRNGKMAKEQHYAALHYRLPTQCGMTFSKKETHLHQSSIHRLTEAEPKTGGVLTLPIGRFKKQNVTVDTSRMESSQHKCRLRCPYHKTQKLIQSIIKINNAKTHIWYCPMCACYYMQPFWVDGHKKILTRLGSYQVKQICFPKSQSTPAVKIKK